MINRTVALLSLVLMSATIPTESIGATRKRLTDAEMRRLAIAGVRTNAAGALRLRGFGFERAPAKMYANRYVEYEATAEPAVPEGSAHVGFYVIDPRTGDMWDGVSECGVVTSPEIRRLQRALRRRLELSAADYAKIRRRGPMCDQ
jgi:hypothetical protein